MTRSIRLRGQYGPIRYLRQLRFYRAPRIRRLLRTPRPSRPFWLHRIHRQLRLHRIHRQPRLHRIHRTRHIRFRSGVIHRMVKHLVKLVPLPRFYDRGRIGIHTTGADENN
jgi:hypothetical protein